MMLLGLVLIGTSLIAGSLASNIQTEAHCSSDFSWSFNNQSNSPCLVAATVNAVCNFGVWDIPALTDSAAYTPPAGPNATVCTCSWASYNLISACTDCQGFSNTTISWSAYSFGCAGELTSPFYFPPNLTLQGSPIPFWATTNPTNWTNQMFDAAAAMNISKEEPFDVGAPTPTPISTPTPTAKPKSKPPIGAIVGGVIGGLVVLMAAIILGICLIRNLKVSRLNRNSDPSPLLMANHTHLRSQSDVAATSNNMSTPNMSTPIGYTSLSSSPMRPTTPTIRTHASSSVRSFPFFSSGGSTVLSPSVRQQSPPPASVHRDETAVEPFILPPTNSHNPDRKQANGAYPMYDPPTAPPVVRMEVRSTTPTQGGRTRYNPPAYTEQTKASPEAGGSSSSRQRSPPTVGKVIAKKGSADTTHSLTSGSGGSAPRVGGSNPAMSNRIVPPTGTMINPQLNTYNVSANTSTNAITGHGRQPSGNTSNDRDRNRPPATDDSFSVRDIA